jgi:sugar phosphate isomerase/epimerase
MHRFRLAVATRCFELPLRQSLKLAADSGAEGVQLDLRQELNPAELNETGRRDLRHLLDELGLRVSGTTFTLRRALGDEHELDRRIAAVKQALSWSFELQSHVMTCRIGRLPAEPDGQAAQLLREILDDLARHANHVGVSLAVTPTQDSAASLQTLLSSIQSGPLGIDFDPAQFTLAGHDPAAALRTLHDFVQHVQLRDGLSEIDGTSAETPVGQGSVPWLELLATLGEIEYAGWLTAIRTQGSNKPGDIARAISYVKRLLLGG